MDPASCQLISTSDTRSAARDLIKAQKQQTLASDALEGHIVGLLCHIRGYIHLDALHVDALHVDALHVDALHVDAPHINALPLSPAPCRHKMQWLILVHNVTVVWPVACLAILKRPSMMHRHMPRDPIAHIEAQPNLQR